MMRIEGPRFLQAYSNLLSHSRLRASHPVHIRHASAPSKGLSEEFRRRQAAAEKQKPVPVMPQPDKYRPPSHGKRASNRNLENRQYGPPLSEADKQRMATKKYPNMMSPEGTWMHWFLHHKYLHFWISMSILTVLATSTWWIEFKHQTLYWHLMPSWSDFFLHPIASGRQVFFVVSKHINQVSEETYYKRLRKREDIERRKEFRFEREREAEERGEEFVYDARYWVGDDGVRRRRVKRWFGIWE